MFSRSYLIFLPLLVTIILYSRSILLYLSRCLSLIFRPFSCALSHFLFLISLHLLFLFLLCCMFLFGCLPNFWNTVSKAGRWPWNFLLKDAGSSSARSSVNKTLGYSRWYFVSKALQISHYELITSMTFAAVFRFLFSVWSVYHLFGVHPLHRLFNPSHSDHKRWVLSETRCKGRNHKRDKDTTGHFVCKIRMLQRW